MIKQLVKILWRFLDILLYILGFGAIIFALFLWNDIAGMIGTGFVLLLTCLLIDTLPRNGGD